MHCICVNLSIHTCLWCYIIHMVIFLITGSTGECGHTQNMTKKPFLWTSLLNRPFRILSFCDVIYIAPPTRSAPWIASDGSSTKLQMFLQIGKKVAHEKLFFLLYRTHQAKMYIIIVNYLKRFYTVRLNNCELLIRKTFTIITTFLQAVKFLHIRAVTKFLFYPGLLQDIWLRDVICVVMVISLPQLHRQMLTDVGVSRLQRLSGGCWEYSDFKKWPKLFF